MGRRHQGEREGLPAPRGRVKKGELQRRRGVHRQGRTSPGPLDLVRIDANAAILLSDKLEPIGTRMIGRSPRELRTERFMKIVPLTPEVL